MPASRTAFSHAAGSSTKNLVALEERGTVDPKRFEGTPAVDELGEIIAASNTEPQDFAARFLDRAGLTAGSSLGREYIYTMYTLWCLVCLDRVDITRLRAGEHLARRLLQINRATRAVPGVANFRGLEFYMRHTEGEMGQVHTPAFDKYVGEVLRSEALVNKNWRLSQEEETALKAPNNKKKKEKGAGKGADE